MTCSWDISAILLDVNNRHIAANWRPEDWVREGQVFTNIARQILKVKFTKYLTTVYFELDRYRGVTELEFDWLKRDQHHSNLFLE